VEDVPKEASLRDPNVWCGFACLKLPDYAGVPNHCVGVLNMDYVQADRSNYVSDGIPLEQASIKIAVRTTDYAAGLTKIHQIARTLDTLQNYTIAVPGDNTGEFDDRNNVPRSAVKQTIMKCTRLETIRDRGLDATSRRYLFDMTYSVRFGGAMFSNY
jgi:hypothetical protein